MYIKLENGIIQKYPYTFGELRTDNPQVSFPSEIPGEILNLYGVFRIEATLKPTVGFDKNVTEGTPELIDGVWKQVWVVSDATYKEHLDRVLFVRANEYPPMYEYLDGIVKGDQEQIDKYINDCLAVKNKYPKPQQG
jgi:hypothetical protein